MSQTPEPSNTPAPTPVPAAAAAPAGHDLPPELVTLVHRGKTFVIWTEASDKAFQKWWEDTPAAKAFRNNRIGKNPRWNKNKHRQQEVWGNFDQAANFGDGTPRVICKKCGTDIIHPTHTGHGTNGMIKHRESKDCLAEQGTQRLDVVVVSTYMTSSRPSRDDPHGNAFIWTGNV